MEKETIKALFCLRNIRTVIKFAYHFEAQKDTLCSVIKELAQKADDYSFGYFSCGEYSQMTAYAEDIERRENRILGEVDEVLFKLEAEFAEIETDILKIGEDIFRFFGENSSPYDDEGANAEARAKLTAIYEIWKAIWADIKSEHGTDPFFFSDRTRTTYGEGIIGAIKALDILTRETTPIRYFKREKEETKKKPESLIGNEPPGIGPKRKIVYPNHVCIKPKK